MTQPNLKRAARLDTKAVALASLPFMGMISFWQVYDGIVPKMLTGTFGLSNSLTGAIMAVDNVFGLFLLPLFGVPLGPLRKQTRTSNALYLGRLRGGNASPSRSSRLPTTSGSLPLLIGAIILTLLAICAYRTMTVAIVADITPRPLRTKADSIEKIVGYAGKGLMLVAISVMVPRANKPNYLPLFIFQAAFILVSAVVYGIFVREPALVEKMREKSLSMGIDEDQIDKDDSPEAGGKDRVADAGVHRSIIMLLAATFFYYMSYNAMTTNISRYADMFYGMEGGSYAIINIVTIAGALLSYVPLANLSLKIGRKKVALGTAVIMVLCPALLWLAPGFSPLLYGVFLLLGVALGGVDLCVYTMILECCSSQSVGRYSGYYYTVSMAAQVATPILSGIVIDMASSCSSPTSRQWACLSPRALPPPNTATPS